jgi:Zn-dependent M16 (insulinase) family peptidase
MLRELRTILVWRVYLTWSHISFTEEILSASSKLMSNPGNLILYRYSARIREDFKRGGLFEGLIRKHLLDNPHKLSLLAVPDNEVGPK